MRGVLTGQGRGCHRVMRRSEGRGAGDRPGREGCRAGRQRTAGQGGDAIGRGREGLPGREWGHRRAGEWRAARWGRGLLGRGGGDQRAGREGVPSA